MTTTSDLAELVSYPSPSSISTFNPFKMMETIEETCRRLLHGSILCEI